MAELVRHDGARLYFEATGPEDGPLLLLIMGLGLSSRAWDELPGRLNHRFRVVVFDNRGVGRSVAPARLFHLPSLADDAAAVLEAVGASQARPAHVFGISLGGMIAQELVLRHPHLVARLALGATNMGWLDSGLPRLGTVISFLLLITRGPGLRARRLADLCVSAGFPDRFAEIWERWILRLDHARPTTTLRQLWAALRHSTRRRLAALKTPTLVITGDDDRIMPPRGSRRIAAVVPGARLVELEGAGHVFPLERPDETVQLLTEHFTSEPLLR
ncbi:MAG: alpha/beta fold hydrolase [Myxococcota bacterium]